MLTWEDERLADLAWAPLENPTLRWETKELLCATVSAVDHADTLETRLLDPVRRHERVARPLGITRLTHKYNGPLIGLLEARPRGTPANERDGLEVARVGVKVLEIIASFHERGALLGDLHPSLIYLDGDEVCVAPGAMQLYAAAKPETRAGMRTQQVTCSKEIVRGLPRGQRSDVQSLGLTLLWLAGGRVHESALQQVMAIDAGEFLPQPPHTEAFVAMVTEDVDAREAILMLTNR